MHGVGNNQLSNLLAMKNSAAGVNQQCQHMANMPSLNNVIKNEYPDMHMNGTRVPSYHNQVRNNINIVYCSNYFHSTMFTPLTLENT